MRAVSEQRLVHECLAKQHLCVLVRPALRWQRLQKHDDALEVHRLELVRPLVQEDRADVEMEVGECIRPFRLDRSNREEKRGGYVSLLLRFAMVKLVL